MASQYNSIARWLLRVRAEHPHMTCFTMPIWVVELPCGCTRERPVPMNGRGSGEYFEETKWQVSIREDGVHHVGCSKGPLSLPEPERLTESSESSVELSVK
jgi:hypothetical protein